MSATNLELKHVQEDHDRLMERHSALLTDMASKERQSRDKQDQLVKLANSSEKARQDAIASLQEQTESLRQNYRVSLLKSTQYTDYGIGHKKLQQIIEKVP